MDDLTRFDTPGVLVCVALNYAEQAVYTMVRRVPFLECPQYWQAIYLQELGDAPEYLWCAHNFPFEPTDGMAWEVAGYMQYKLNPISALANVLPWRLMEAWGEDSVNVYDAGLYEQAKIEVERLKFEVEQQVRLAKEAAQKAQDAERESLRAKFAAMRESAARFALSHPTEIRVRLVDGGVYADKSITVRHLVTVPEGQETGLAVNEMVVRASKRGRKPKRQLFVITHVPSGLTILPKGKDWYESEEDARVVASALASSGVDWKNIDENYSVAREVALRIAADVGRMYELGVLEVRDEA